jgi:hypothetical protein
MNAAKSAVRMTRATTVCKATTVAERTFTSRAARSPISWPGPRSAITRSPPSSPTRISVSPLRMTATLSASSPSRMSRAPAANTRLWALARKSRFCSAFRQSQKLPATVMLSWVDTEETEEGMAGWAAQASPGPGTGWARSARAGLWTYDRP